MKTNKSAPLIDVEFSLALYNRTGKYFIGRDLLGSAGLPLGDTYYWRVRSPRVPQGLRARIIGKLQHLQIKGRLLGGGLGLLPRRRSNRPVLHLDPFSIPSTVLRQRDAVLCHDIGPVTHPDLFDADVSAIYRKIYEEIARVGPHVIFVSLASQKAFETMFPEASLASSTVIYPPLRQDLDPITAESMQFLDGKPFLLTVGSIGARKNQLRTIAAFEHSGLADEGVHFVMCGAREPGFEAVKELASKTRNVIMLDYVSDAQLAWLYGNARGFVLASLLEGFGMPVSEAVAHGQLPLVSENSVLHEVAGDAAVMVNPLDIASIARGMRVLANLDVEERRRRVAQSQSTLARFSTSAFQQGWMAILMAMAT